MSYFGDTIKELRTQQILTQKELAEDLGVSLSMVSLWEKGANFPTVSKLIEIADYFNISIDSLLGTDGQPITQPELSEDESDLLALYKQLSPERQREAIVWLKTMKELDRKHTEKILQKKDG